MAMLKPKEKRSAPRHQGVQLASLFFGSERQAQYCIVRNFSDTGVRIATSGYRVPDMFEIRFTNRTAGRNGFYRVIWRVSTEGGNDEVGAQLVSAVSPEH